MLLQRNITEEIVWVNGSFSLLHRAILNLILNAVKYGDNNTEVLIELILSANSSQTKLSITNRGIGIPLDQQAHLFKRFSRVNEYEVMISGYGFGLYFVKTVADKHQAVVQVTSDSNKPTTFTLILPTTTLTYSASCNATQDLSYLGATSKLRLTSARLNPCSLNKRTASFLHSSVKIRRGIRFIKSPNKLIN